MSLPTEKARVKPSNIKRFAVKQVVERGRGVSGVARELGVARKTVYSWIRRYKETPSRSKFKSFDNRYAEGDRHPKAVAGKALPLLKRLIVLYPNWGCRKYSEELKKKGIDLGYFGVHQLLKSLDASTPDLRRNFKRSWSGPGRLEADIKLEIVKKVLSGEMTVSQASEEYEIARKTIYQWIRKYQAALEKDIVGLEALKEAYVKGETHPRAIYPELQPRLLKMVAREPELSVHRLANRLPASSWTVWKVLDRNSLNNYEQRLAFAQVQKVTVQAPAPRDFIDRVRYVLEQFIPSLAPAPPPRSVYMNVARLFKPFFASLLLVSLFSYGALSWIRIISQATSFSSALGLIFASIALLMGSFFFLYSFKYYITLALVLSFSQTEGIKDTGDRVQDKRKNVLSWILGLANGDVKSRRVGTTSQAVGLTPNLEHIKLKRYPKISVHIPFYNEKNVVERAIRAATNFDYQGEYEIVLCDDSIDRTSDIIRAYQKKYLARGQRLEVREGNGWILTSVEVRPGVTLKHLHRTTRSGFKGGALRLALKVTDPKVEFVSIFDADFVPYPDTLELFLKYFQATTGTLDFQKGSRVQAFGSEVAQARRGIDPNAQNLKPKPSPIAAVQGYQWHVLNKSENWITRGIRSEYAGSYVIERSGTEIYGGLKMISGAVYMIRRDVLEEIGWETSITEDFQLTLKLYEKGYKVVYTPYIQAPAECVSTLKRLIRQRMRWAEGHSNNIRRMFIRLMFGKWEEVNPKFQILNPKQYQNSNYQNSKRFEHLDLGNSNLFRASNLDISASSKKKWVPSPLTLSEKLEFLYLSPYYLQAFFFLLGTISWLISETVFPARLPFWTSLWGWSLVLTNMLSLPLMNAVGMFLEESEEKDYAGLPSFIALSYIVVPFQAYSSLKGFLKGEGPWFRTPKTGRITDILKRGTFYRFISGILPGRPAVRAQSLATSLKPKTSNYLALSTANNRFNSFNLKPKRMRWIGKAGVSLVVLLALFINYLGLFVQPTQAAAPGGEWWDSNYQYRQKITVSTGANSPSGGYNGYTVRFTIDTLTDDSKFEDNCDDLRIARWNGGGWDELPRHVIDNNCYNAASDVRFKLAADISASSSDDDYYVYYGYSSAGTPTALGTTNVYSWWDDATSNRSSSYTFGRCDAWHGTGYTAWAYDTTGNDSYDIDTDDNYTGCFRYAANERDAYIEAEWYHTGAYATDMTSGLIGRYILSSGTGGTEDASHYYATSRAESSYSANGYPTDGDIVEGTRTATVVDGTDLGDVAWSQWRKQGMAIWGINDTSLKYWDSETVSGFGPQGWPSVSTNASGTDSTDQEGSGDWGLIAAQDVVDARYILIRRYVETEPSTALATEEVVPEVVLLLLPFAILLPAIVRKFRNGEDLGSFAPNFFISKTSRVGINARKVRFRYRNKDPG